MKTILQILSVTGLLLTLMPSILYAWDVTGPGQVNFLTFTGTIVWFGSAIFWLGRKKEQAGTVS